MDQKALQELLELEPAKKFQDPRYEELLATSFYVQHVLRMDPEQWPDPVLCGFAKLNRKIYIPMQGLSEMGASGILEK
jgi:proline iminopeptidase